jgi:hypothetical protein
LFLVWGWGGGGWGGVENEVARPRSEMG